MSEHDEVELVLQSYARAVGARDVEAFTALYVEDVRIFDTWGRWCYVGLDEWRGMAEGWFGSLGDERVGVDFAEVQVRPVGDAAVASAFTTYRGLSAEGEELRSMTNRLTWVLERRDGAWKVVHEHTSVPVAFEDGKGILQR